MFKKLLPLTTLMVILAISQPASAQQKTQKEFKFGKIDPTEFAIKASGKDSAASAIKIFDIGDCYFEINPTTRSFAYVFERHIRYKILTKAGYDYANYKIGLSKSSNSRQESLDKMDAATYNMVDGKMVISKLNKDSKFTEEFNKNYTYKKFTLPNVKEGSIIEFKYKIKSDYIFNLREWKFQSEIPTLYSEYTVYIPQYLNYKFNMSGYFNVSHPLHESSNANYVNGVNSNATKDKYVAENVPALKDEPFVTTLDDYISKIDFELRATNFPDDIYRDYNGTWPKIINELLDDENFGGYAKKNSYAKNILPTILKGEKDTLKVTNLIFDYVKQNIKWNKNYNFYSTETNPKTIFEKKTGNSADINLALMSLINEAKIKCYPVLISTRENGRHPGVPNISKFDNVIAFVNIGNTSYFLDATEKEMPFGMMAYQNLNHEGFLIVPEKKEGMWVSTETNFGDEKIFSYNLSLDTENKFKGVLSEYSKGFASLRARNRYKTATNEQDYLKDYKKKKAGLNIKKYTIENLDSLNNMLSETFDVDIEDNVEEAGNLIYFNPFLYERTTENLFKHDTRNFPVDFGHPIKESIRVTVKFPEGYTIESLPKSISYKLENDGSNFTVSYFQEGNTILARSNISINKSLYSPDDYFTLKELFKLVVDKQSEKIVFKKKA